MGAVSILYIFDSERWVGAHIKMRSSSNFGQQVLIVVSRQKSMRRKHEGLLWKFGLPAAC